MKKDNFEDIKKEYEENKIILREYISKENELLKRMRKVCPHINTYKMDTFGSFEEESKYDKHKCNDCFEIVMRPKKK